MEQAISPSGCVHALPGRLRVKVTAIKKVPAAACQVEQALQQERGVTEAVANPITDLNSDDNTRYPFGVLAPAGS